MRIHYLYCVYEFIYIYIHTNIHTYIHDLDIVNINIHTYLYLCIYIHLQSSTFSCFICYSWQSVATEGADPNGPDAASICGGLVDLVISATDGPTESWVKRVGVIGMIHEIFVFISIIICYLHIYTYVRNIM